MRDDNYSDPQVIELQERSFDDTPVVDPFTAPGGVIGIGEGGTGAADATGARANLGAAQSGANSDITSLAGLTTPLSVAQGGTAATTAATARTSLGIDAVATKKSNLSAAVAPTVADDSSAGYAIGSFWIDTVLQDGYWLMDASVGAAVWKKITP
jgi:hypothetical protein